METQTIFQIISVVLIAAILCGTLFFVKQSRIFKFKTTLNIPNIGQYWPEYEGVYAGIAIQENGEDGDGHIILLDIDFGNTNMRWIAAIEWAKVWGKGARLPSQVESALLYTNVLSHIEKVPHWTSTQISENIAIVQDFTDGFQHENNTACELAARAIVRIPVTQATPAKLLQLSLKLQLARIFA